MRHQRHTLLVAALVVAVIAAVPGGAVAADGPSVSGDQADDGTVTVTVTENNTTVANASVTVEALNNSSYVDEGDHATGENGTVELAAPEENVSVAVTAEVDNTTAETTLDLVAPTDDSESLSVGVSQADDGSATVSVTNASGASVANASVAVTEADNATYAGAGDYATDENGTVGLPAPKQNVTVDVTAAANGLTAETTATLTASNDSGTEAPETFGQRVASFVAQLQADGNVSGQAVSAFVVDNNPGADNRPDHVDPGPKDDDSDEDDEKGANGNGHGAEGNNGNGNGAGANGNGSGAGNGNGNAGGNGNNGNGAESSDNGGPGNGNGNGNGGGNGNSNPGKGN